MTTVATRTPTSLKNARFVETPTGPSTPPPAPKPTYVPNPYSFHMRAAFTLTCGSGGATVWAVGHDNPYAPLLWAVTLLLAAATTGLTVAFNGREQAAEVLQ